MRLNALIFTGVLGAAVATVAVPARAQEPTPKADSLNLPVSLAKIRESLLQPPPAEPLKGLNDPPPTFHVAINEQQKFDEFLAKVKFDKGGPQVAGGADISTNASFPGSTTRSCSRTQHSRLARS